ncbi:MAG TPA: ATP-binding protein [Leptolyngbyaceae cyanobacterium]
MVSQDLLCSYDEHSLIHYFETVQQWAQLLQENVNELGGRQPQRVVESLQQLSLAIEELQVAEEELRVQHEHLIAAHNALALGQQRYKELFEFAPDAYLVTDLEGIIQEANHAAELLFKVSQQDLLGRPCVNFVLIEQRSSFQAVLSQLPTIRRVQEWELPLCRRGGEPFQAAMTVEATADLESRVTGLRWMVRDISARKQAEAKLQEVQRQNLELIEAERLKDSFLATISHEFRTPLSSILGFAHLLMRRAVNQRDQSLIDMTQRIHANGQRLLGLVDSLLDFSRLKSKSLELRLAAFDLTELAIATLEEIRPLAQQKGLDLCLQNSPAVLPIVNDVTRMQQILTNLISNAIKFTEVGSVTLEIWELPEGRVAIIVRDTGIGVDLANQSRIFQEFWQVNQGIARSHEGTGLGLAIVNALVKSMQGTISIDSQPGQGSTFRVELPRRLQPVCD